MKKIILKILFIVLLIVSCDRPPSYFNPFDPESNDQGEKWCPDSLSVECISDSKILLTWRQTNLLIDGFEIFRSDNGDQIDSIAAVDTFDRAFLDTALIFGTNYSYYLRATANNNRSEFDTSNILQTTFPAPQNFGIISVNDSATVLSWEYDTNEEEGFIIERSIEGVDFKVIGIVGYDTTQYDDTLSSVGHCKYRSKAFSIYNESLLSPEISLWNEIEITSGTTISDQSIKIEWLHDCDFEKGYIIERSIAQGTFEEISRILENEFEYIDSGLTIDTEYNYRVKAYSSKHTSSASDPMSKSTRFEVPRGLRTIQIDDQSLRLEWLHDCVYETGYIIERKNDSDVFVEIARTNANELTYVDTALSLGVIYEYRVCALSEINISGYSNIASGQTLFLPPVSLTLQALDDQSVRLDWQHECSFEDGYIIERKNGSAPYTEIGRTAENICVYSDTGLTINTNYDYRVKAYTRYNISPASNNEIISTILPAPSNLSTQIINVKSINLSWEHDCNFDHNGFIIQRSENMGAYAEISRVNMNTSSYYDSGLSTEIQYSYRVFAYTDNNISGSSQINCTIPAFEVPENLAVNVNSEDHLTITWNHDCIYENGFKLERKISDDSFVEIADLGNDVLIYVDEDISIEGTYSYRVRAISAGIYTPYSSQDNVTLSKPVVRTLDNAEAYLEHAIVNGIVVNNGNLNHITKGFCWSEDTNPDILDNVVKNTDQDLDYKSQINSLDADKTYYVRAYAENAVGLSYGDSIKVNTLPMILIDGGTFTMGDTWGDGDLDEQNTHDVTLDDYYLLKHEVTIKEYLLFLNNYGGITIDGYYDSKLLIDIGHVDSPIHYDAIYGYVFEPNSFADSINCPVFLVSWFGAIEYCNWLSNMAGYNDYYDIVDTNVTITFINNGFRLPTEAEWEYAARGGGHTQHYKYSGSNDINNVSWYKENSFDLGIGHEDYCIHVGGNKDANELELYDMSGNVWEWCWDWYGVYTNQICVNPIGASTGERRVMRGGSWPDEAHACRVSNRGERDPSYCLYSGFRLAKNGDTPPDNSRPSIDNLVSDTNYVKIGNSVQITCYASDNDNDDLIYSWKSNAGEITGDSAIAVFTAPYDKENVIISCMVCDGKGGESYGNISITVDDDMIFVGGGEFWMGNIWNEVANQNDRPVHFVALSDYSISKYEITHEDYITFLNDIDKSILSYDAYGNLFINGNIAVELDDGDCEIGIENGKYYFQGSNIASSQRCPITEVSWFGAIEYCNWLSEKSGLGKVYTVNSSVVEMDVTQNGYRLPTEAEWEFAARSRGSENQKYSGTVNEGQLVNYAWYSSNSLNKNHIVGSLDPNELGLYDMSGNAFEWIWNWDAPYDTTSKINPVGPLTGNVRMRRGGSWKENSYSCRTCDRNSKQPGLCDNDLSFRITKNEELRFNNPPVISRIDISPKSIKSNWDTEIRCIAYDPEGQELTYEWSSNGGIFNKNDSIVTFTSTTNEGAYYITCKAFDGYDETTHTSYFEIEDNMVYIFGGDFRMGEIWGDVDTSTIPIHNVTLSDFIIAEAEVTNQAYIDFLNAKGISFDGKYNGNLLIEMEDSRCAIGHNGSNFYFRGADKANQSDCPVILVTWIGAIEYCNWFSTNEGLNPCYTINNSNVSCDFNANGYRLLTDAEWEYAARSAGREDRKYTGTNIYNEIDTYAWTIRNSSNITHPVKTRDPNDIGIYDMIGNVWEHCWDWYSTDEQNDQIDPVGPSTGTRRVHRGGGWDSDEPNCKTTHRHKYTLQKGWDTLGFRIGRNILNQ